MSRPGGVLAIGKVAGNLVEIDELNILQIIPCGSSEGNGSRLEP